MITKRNEPMKKILGFESLGTAGAVAVFAMSLSAVPAAAEEVTLYKNPQCGCCEAYADYLRENGFTVEVKPTYDLAEISRDADIPDNFQCCHTAFLGDYVVSGHVPIDVVNRVLQERPEIVGVTLPGMPLGSPGMSGAKQEPFKIYTVEDGVNPTVYAVE
jgi:hypothetical protein